MPSCTQRQPETRGPAASKRLRAAVIGLGVGEAHVAGYQAHEGCDVVALCDFDRRRLEEIGARVPGADLLDSADEVLCDLDIDVVSIASYDNHHYEQIVKALTHDKHVFVEKPLCLTEQQAVEIRELSDAKPQLKLSSNLILRRCPRFLALKEQIEQGALGEVFLVEGQYEYGRLHKITEGWRGAIDFYSVVYGGAIHLVDLLLWLTGDRIVEVAAFGNQVVSQGSQFRYNDTVVAALRFAEGTVGKVGVSYGCVRPHFHELKVYGTKATFINGYPHGMLYESRDPQVVPTAVTEAYPGVQKGALIGEFLDAILSGKEPAVGRDEVFQTMAVCLAIEQAVAEGTTQSVRAL